MGLNTFLEGLSAVATACARIAAVYAESGLEEQARDAERKRQASQTQRRSGITRNRSGVMGDPLRPFTISDARGVDAITFRDNTAGGWHRAAGGELTKTP